MAIATDHADCEWCTTMLDSFFDATGVDLRREAGHGEDEAAVRRAQPEAGEDAHEEAERAPAAAADGAAVAAGGVGACPCGCGERT